MLAGCRIGVVRIAEVGAGIQAVELERERGIIGAEGGADLVGTPDVVGALTPVDLGILGRVEPPRAVGGVISRST
jgi:hypothetical protein